jgi:hypothetical protein
MWVRMAVLAVEKLPEAGTDAEFYQTKLQTARFFMERILPQAGSLLFTIKAGKASLMETADTAF